MIKTNIVVQDDFGVLVELGMDCGLRFRPDKMVCSRDVEHQRVGNGVAFIEHRINHDAIISNRRVDVGARRSHIGEATAQAVTDATDFLHGGRTQFTAANRVDGGFDVLHPVIGLILSEIAKGFLKLFFNIGIKFDPGCKTPEYIDGNRQIASLSPFVALLPDAWIHAENFGDHDHRSFGFAGGFGDIGTEHGVFIESTNLGHLAHDHSPEIKKLPLSLMPL